MRTIAHRLAAVGVTAVVVAGSALAATPAYAEGENVAAVAVDDAYSTSMSTQLVVGTPGVLANDIDPDSELAIFSVDATGLAGTVSVNNDGQLTYNPTPGFTGSTSFQYRAQEVESSRWTEFATVTITVTPPVNYAPVGVADAYSTPFETPVTVTAANGLRLNDSDPEGDYFVAVSDWVPSTGTLSGVSDQGTFTYTPPAGFSGDATFTYTPFDLTTQGAPVTVTITVLPPVVPPAPTNTAPVGAADGYTMYQGGSLSVPAAQGVLANDSDADGDPLSLAAWTTLGLPGETNYPNADGSFVFEPPVDFVGDYVFSYAISDGTDTSPSIPITIQVLHNPAPQAVGDEYVMTQGETLHAWGPTSPLANDTDPNGDELSMLDLETDGGLVTLSWGMNGEFWLTPPADFTGVITGSYTATDGITGVTGVPITITVVEADGPAANSAPVASDDSYLVAPGEAFSAPAPGVLIDDADADGDPLVATALTTPALGTGFALGADGVVQWTAPADFCGSVTFDYAISDGVATSAPATVTLIAYESGETRGGEIGCSESEESADPETPTEPTEPSDPSDPSGPTEPVEPTAPELPTQPLPEVTLAATPRTELAQTGAPERLLGDLGATALLALLLGVATLATSARRRVRHAG